MQVWYSVLSSWETPTVPCNPIGLRVCQGAAPVLPCSVNVQSISIFEFNMRLFMRAGGSPFDGNLPGWPTLSGFERVGGWVTFRWKPSGVAYPFGFGFERVGRSSPFFARFTLVDFECSGQRLR